MGEKFFLSKRDCIDMQQKVLEELPHDFDVSLWLTAEETFYVRILLEECPDRQLEIHGIDSDGSLICYREALKEGFYGRAVTVHLRDIRREAEGFLRDRCGCQSPVLIRKP